MSRLKESRIDIAHTVRGSSPRIPFAKIATGILGSSYTLSVVVCGDRLAQRLNQKYRKKTYAPNVLAFPIDTHEGEIILNVRKAEREAHTFNTTFKKHLTYLFIHACLHLTGLDHGKKMDSLEKQYLKKVR